MEPCTTCGWSPIGIPYARQEWDGDRHYVVCPRCDKAIVLSQRKDFESFTGREYAAHFMDEHACSSHPRSV